MKYLVLEAYAHVAIPLEALQACGEVKLVESKYVGGELERVFWNSGRRLEGRVIDASQILDEEPEDKKEEGE